jgi:hypothetical protein
VTLPLASATGPRAKEARARCATSPGSRCDRAPQARVLPLAAPAVAASLDTAGVTILTDLPRRVPTMRDEVAIWRAFLSTEIDAIMRGEG